MSSDLTQRSIKTGLKMTDQRRIVLQVIDQADDHTSVDTIHRRARELDSSISVATVYRTLKFLDEMNLVHRHKFNEKQARFETNIDHHHHMIGVADGDVLEFQDNELEALIEAITDRLGYELFNHNLELYGRKAQSATS